MKKIILLSLITIYGCTTKSKDSEEHLEIINIVNETQKIISVKKGQQIDTARFRTLFLPTAHFTVVGEENGKQLHETMNLKAFLETLSDEYYSNGYYETGKGHIIEQYNGIAQVIQSFYGEDSEGEKGWGVNSYQLVKTGKHWRIANMVWSMSPKGEEGIPSRLLEN